jgi:hypothetical protein
MLTYILLFVGAVVCVVAATIIFFRRAEHGEQREKVVQFPADKRREKLG